MRVIYWRDKRESDWDIFKRAWEVRKYQNQAKKTFRQFFYKNKPRNGTVACRRAEMETFAGFLCKSFMLEEVRGNRTEGRD